MLWTFVAIVALITLYAVFGRAWLKQQPWAQGFFAAIEPIEIWLWSKSETILAARLLQWGGALVTAHDTVAMFASGLDWTPVTSRLLASIPPDVRPLVISAALAVIGGVIEWLRRKTTKPLEIVALPDAVAATIPEVVVADVTKAEAVAAVAEAKAEGAV